MSAESLQVFCKEDCGNAPKKELLRDLSIALARKDFHIYLEWLRDDIIWEVIGENKIQGKTEVESYMSKLFDQKVKELHIHNIITHGNTASLNATVIFENNNRIDYCDVYRFGGFGKKAKIKEITSYIIKGPS